MGQMSGNIKGSKIELNINIKKNSGIFFAINQHIILFSFSLNYKIISINY